MPGKLRDRATTFMKTPKANSDMFLRKIQSRRRRKSPRFKIQFFPEISPRRDLARRRRISSEKLIFTRFCSKIAPYNPRSINRSDEKRGGSSETAGKRLGCCNLGEEKRGEEEKPWDFKKRLRNLYHFRFILPFSLCFHL